MINFVVARKPLSYNSCKKKNYMNEFVNCCQRRYKKKLKFYKSERLYGLVYYFFRENLQLDTDNLSKPIWDSLNGVIYNDDSQIITRSVTSINLQENDINMIDLTGLDGKIVIDIIYSIFKNNHTLYVECGLVNRKMWKFNIEDLCR